VPGDGRYEWAGFLDPDVLPRVVNPPQGFVATANEMNLPPDWDHTSAAVGFEWAERSRSARIHEVLRAERPHSMATSCALQTDSSSMPARRVVSVLSRIPRRGATRALDLLHGWDRRLTADSAPAALFEVWWTKHLKPGLFERVVADEGIRRLLAPGDVEAILRLIENPDGRLGTDPSGARDRLLADTLDAAFRDCAARMGEDPRSWRWGRIHHGYFEHPLSALAPASDPSLDIGPFPKGGSASTPMHAGYRPSDFRIIAGASVRIVIDVGDWDRSRCINAPGQSGDPRSVHYADLAPLWASGQYVPLLYSPDAVNSAARNRLELSPSAPEAACAI
jgi:penicillin amidase